ncbi:Inositol hexakisphosphate kinase 3 [Pelomyxa schiedti]|nr:Inositol hexakisphosphate kinase 3 [Pelomyxa schiedti]
MATAPRHQPDAADQVGGHGGKQGLVFEGNRIYKPALMPKEKAFYESIQASGENNGSVAPRYYGCVTRDTQWGPLEYMILENITTPMKFPSMLDMKLGTRTWDADCSPEKKAGHIERAEQTTSVMYGFVFCGMKVYNKVEQRHTKYPKHFGWDARTDEKMQAALGIFLHDGEKVRKDAIVAWLPKIAALRAWYAQRKWHMFAASLLFAYDVDAEGAAQPDIRLIDFAHSWNTSTMTPEERTSDPSGVLTGIDNLVSFLKKFL